MSSCIVVNRVDTRAMSGVWSAVGSCR